MSDEFGLQYAHDTETRCSMAANNCTVHVNAGCLVVQMPELFRHVTETQPFEMIVVDVPKAK